MRSTREVARGTRDVAVPTSLVGWSLLALLCAAQFMVALDVTVVNVALPSIARSMSLSSAEAQWVASAYLICTGGLTLLGGRAGDVLGRRRTLLGGLFVFTAASLASGLASDAVLLILCRGAQGVGAAFLSPAALSTITTMYEGDRRTKALSVWGAVGASGFALGLLVGGMLTTWLSWHWIFYINVPIGTAALVAIPALVRVDGETPASFSRLPAMGSALLTAGLVAVVYGIAFSTAHGWASTGTIGALTAGAALLLAFGASEARGGRPLVPSGVWGSRSVQGGLVTMFGITSVLAGTLFVATFFIQQQLHSSALRTGLYYLPFAAAVGMAAHLGPHVLGHLGFRYTAVTALLAVAVGALMLSLVPSHASYAGNLLPGLLILGAGTGFTFVTASVTAMSEIGKDQTGGASGLLTTGHEFGGALGVAVLSTVASSAGAGKVPLQIAYGHHAALLVAAATATGLAGLAAVVIPSRRPDPNALPASLH